MRKKYLSALLFGALLVTSAGTFTSCKDYDDDINNLQGQIDEIKTTLSELEKQVGTTGVSSVTFDEETGVLTVVDASGTPKTYKIQTSADTKVDATISEDGILTINGEEIGKVRDGGDTVTVEGDKLLVNGDVVATIPSGNFVTMIKDEANKTVTITDGNETVTLPYGADAAVTPAVEAKGDLDDNTWQVAWGVAASDITFGDATYKTGDLLLGGMTHFAEVTVKPITYDLSAQTLKLIDIDGNYAKVKVVPTTEEETGTTSRAMVSANGEWKLSLVMDESVTAENVETAFTKKVNGVDQNLKYALTVNGTRVTGYDFVIDTDTKNESEAREAITKDDFIKKEAKAATGEVTLSIADFAVEGDMTDKSILSRTVASSMSLNDIEAEAAGVKVEGMKVTIPAGYTGETINVKLSILDVTGAKSEREAKIIVKASEVEEVSQVKQVEVAISADGKFTVEFGDIFTNLDANVVKAIKKYKLTTADQNFFALNSLTPDDNNIYTINNNSKISFLKSDKKTGASWNNNGARDIAYATVELPKAGETSAAGDSYLTGATDKANLYGTFTLTLSMCDDADNVLKKIEIPVKVVAPEFADYYTKNANALWVNGGVSKIISASSNVVTSLVSKTDGLYLDNNKAIVKDAITYTYSYTATNGRKANKIAGTDVDLKIASTDADFDGDNTTPAYFKYPILKEKTTGSDASTVYTGRYELKVSTITVTASSEIANVVTKENAPVETITVSENFDLNLSSEVAGAKLEFYKEGVLQTKAIVNNDDEGGASTITSFAEYVKEVTDEGKDVKTTSGLALVIGDDVIPFKWYNTASSEGEKVNISLNDINGEDPNGYNAWKSTETQFTGGNTAVKYVVSTDNASFGTLNGMDGANLNIRFTGLSVGQGGKLTVELVDKYGIQTNVSIDYVKEDTIISTDDAE